MCRSPRLIAAYHGLHRLRVPRHPPHAFSRLTTSLLNRRRTSAPNSFRTRRSGSAFSRRRVHRRPALAVRDPRREEDPYPTISSILRFSNSDRGRQAAPVESHIVTRPELTVNGRQIGAANRGRARVRIVPIRRRGVNGDATDESRRRPARRRPPRPSPHARPAPPRHRRRGARTAPSTGALAWAP